MRLLVTVESADSGMPQDVVVNYDPDTRVRDLAAQLSGVRPGVPSNVIAMPGTAIALQGAPDLFIGETRLDPAQTIDESDLRHGVVLGVGGASTQRDREPDGLVEIRVSSGPTAGHVHRLGIGRATIGTGRHATIRIPALADVPEMAGLDDVVLLEVGIDGGVTITPSEVLSGLTTPVPLHREPLTEPIVLEASVVTEGVAKRRLRRKEVAPEFQIGERVDPMAPVPMVHLDRRAVTGSTPWKSGQTLGLGPVLLDRTEITEPDASLSPSPSSPELDYNRPPRMHPAARPTEFAIPAEPQQPEKVPFPMAMLIAPVVLGVASTFFFKSPYALIMMAMSPIMMLANSTGTRKQQRLRYRDQLAEYRTRRISVEQAAVTSLLGERSSRRRYFPDPASVLLFATGPRARLWERRPWDRDFLHLRLGTADLPSEVTIKDPKRAEHEGPLQWTAPDVPATIPLTELGIVGVAGSAEQCRSVAMWSLAQVAALHSPSDVSVTVIAASDASPDWDWAKWLPHARNSDDHPRPFRIAVDDDSRSATINELIGELERRKSLEERERGGLSRHVIVLDGARELRMASGMVSLLKEGPMVGLYFVCLDRAVRELPEECRTVAEFSGGQLNLEINEQRRIDAIRTDVVEQAWLDRLSRALSPIRDVSTEDLSSMLPGASRLLDVLHLQTPTGEALSRVWSAGGRTTRAIIGEGGDGPFQIDIRADGPHGLIAGTTGSGKSELLQTIIASLAYGNRPDEFNFVLIDYKGGAAFKDCMNLPHTVGTVTDLDGHLTTRALDSLGAELRRREHQLADAGAKDIEDYLAAREPDDQPMPRLLIIIDEFAALVAELPDFVNGLVDIARRGRSLGVHLILATQRPAGVVSAEIKSNTNLRIALRVTDAGDSSDVLEAPDAAHIAKSTPGRGYARLGHSSLVAFQSSRVGGRPRRDDEAADVGVWPIPFERLGTPQERGQEAEEDVSVPTDLAAFVQAARDASESTGIHAPPSPWLPAMADELTLDDVLSDFPSAVPSPENLVIPFGLVDVPTEQRRDVATFDIASGGHLSVVSAPRVGRSTMLRAIAGAIGRFTSPADVHVYGVDCGNNALLPLVALPHVGAIVSRDQTDRMDRLLSRLRQLISERQQALALAGFADVTEQRAHVPADERMPYLVILFDRWEGFFQAYDGLDGGRLVLAWQQILQEGAGAGIKVVMTGDRSLTIGRMSTLFDDKLMMRMVDMSDFSTIGLTSKQIPSSMTEGRGFRAEGLKETQVALLTDDPAGTAQVAALQAISRDATERYDDLPRSQRPFRLDVLPIRIGLEEARALVDEPLSPSTLVLAVGGDTLGLRTLDAFEHGPALLVTGSRRSGRSTTLQTMATFALQTGWKVVVVTPRMSPLRAMCSADDVHGPFDETSDEAEVRALFEELRSGEAPVLTLVDDVELLGADGWLPTLLSEHIEKLRDSGSILAASGTPSEMGGLYRGPVVALKRSGSGLMLSPQTAADADMFGARMARSALGQTLPPGAGYLLRTASTERVQVIWPE